MEKNPPAQKELIDTIVIDRPIGFVQTIEHSKGTEVVTYPLNYGFIPSILNPDDGEGLDVYIGTAVTPYDTVENHNCFQGRFMKGVTWSGEWVADERKWFARLTYKEFGILLDWWESRNRTIKIMRQLHLFSNETRLVEDIYTEGVPATLCSYSSTTPTAPSP